MARKKHTPEQVVNLLRQIEVLVANEKTTVKACKESGLPERRACRMAHQPYGTQRYRPTEREDEDRLTQAIVALASEI